MIEPHLSIFSRWLYPCGVLVLARIRAAEDTADFGQRCIGHAAASIVTVFGVLSTSDVFQTDFDCAILMHTRFALLLLHPRIFIVCPQSLAYFVAHGF